MTPNRLVFLVALSVTLSPPQENVAAQTEPRPSSFTLIDRALSAKTIDAETAHRYRVLAAFGDTRLPVAYRGDDSHMRALPPSVAEVGALLPTFSAATRAELAPFFKRPDEPGSWVNLSTIPSEEPVDGRRGRGDSPVSSAPPAARVTWKAVSAVGGKAKVWWQDRYPRDSATAQGLARELTALIWGKLTGLMNQEPYPDNGIVSNGGDAAFDFYLIHAPATWAGLTRAAIEEVPCHPARYILIDTRRHGLGSARSYGVLQIATHELMHAITFAYRVRGGCPAPWIREASGDWASNWVYPLTDGEHPDAGNYISSVQYQIDNPSTVWGDSRFYGEHLFPYFLEKATGGPGFMPRMWANFRNMDVLQGVNAVLPGGFVKSWPKFLVRLWNQPPVDAPDGFKQWDRLARSVAPTGGIDNVAITSDIETRKITFIPENPAQLIFATGIQPVAGHYRHYTFDRSVRTVTFRNTIREEALLHGTVWGIEKIRGTWRDPADWTEELQKAWCRDEATEDLEALVLIFGNHDWQNLQAVNPREPPTVEARGTGCTGWRGTHTLVNTLVVTDPAVTIVETVTSDIQFAVDSELVHPGRPREYWKSVGGTIRWRAQVTGVCTGSGSGSVPIRDLPDDKVATLNIWAEGGKMHHSGGNGPWPGDIPRYAVTCATGPSEMMLYGALGFFVTDGVHNELAPDGKSFRGQFTNSPQPGQTVSHTYSFRCTIGC